jgi:hypothetical protein
LLVSTGKSLVNKAFVLVLLILVLLFFPARDRIKALSFIDEYFPFSRSFGRASSRDEVIASAHTVYYRLMSLNPERSSLSCEIINLLALEDDEVSVNMPKKKLSERFFAPTRIKSYRLSLSLRVVTRFTRD